MSASRKVVERRCLKLINSDYTTFHLVLTISNVFQKMYRIGGDMTQGDNLVRDKKKLCRRWEQILVVPILIIS